MSAGKYTLKIEQGAYKSLSLTYKDATGTPIDLTGYTARMQIRGYAESTTAWVSLTSASGITLGTTDGAIDIELTSTQTSAIPDSGFYDIELVAPSGEVNRILEGAVKLSKEITR